MSESVLEMRGIRKSYYGVEVLKGVDLICRPGEIHALVGENGAGKSTLMNVLFGMPVIAATGGFTGSVRLAGEEVRIASPRAAMDLGVGMVHQEFMLLPEFTVAENVKLAREPIRNKVVGKLLPRSLCLLDRPKMRGDTGAALDHLGIDLDPGFTTGQLPVGSMQFVEIARELDKEQVRLLVFDEPTAVLTESEAAQLLAAMQRLAAEGIAILFITHRLDEVHTTCERVTVLRDGEVVAVREAKSTPVAEIASLMVGREVHHTEREADSAVSEDTVLSIRGLEVDMPGERVRGVDLEVRRGEILGIGGLAGQGKVGIANGVFGLFPARGKVWLEGRPLGLGDPRGALAAGLAFVSEDRRGTGLLLDESIEHNIAVTSIVAKGQFLRDWFLGPLNPVDRGKVRAHAEELIGELDIRCTGPTQPVGRLSGGNQQKVCLARALTLEPKVLFVSEPTRGIDVGAKALVLDQLVRLNRTRGTTIVMASSELAELRTICDRVAIVSEGKVAGILDPEASDAHFGLLMAGEDLEAALAEAEKMAEETIPPDTVAGESGLRERVAAALEAERAAEEAAASATSSPRGTREGEAAEEGSAPGGAP